MPLSTIFQLHPVVSLIGGGNQRKQMTCRKLRQYCVEYASPERNSNSKSLVVMGTDCKSSHRSNYITITTTTSPSLRKFSVVEKYAVSCTSEEMLYWQLYFDSKETIVSLCAYRYDSSNKSWGRRVRSRMVVGWTAYASRAPGFTPSFSRVPHHLCFLCCAVRLYFVCLTCALCTQLFILDCLFGFFLRLFHSDAIIIDQNEKQKHLVLKY